ncbi:MAG TPA: AsmA-like C-terminal region-containing protein [Pseudolabrys sp.]|nr:AsmA-like C-terminal region-containing protein [Pseudolabrys sp.]
MQNTLLALAIAIILALLAALVGPLLIDWGTHRSLFETEASRLIGVEVRVTGPIEVRLLPTPSFTLHEVEIGERGEGQIDAKLVGVELALGPLMRGDWQASEMHLVGPRINLGLDAAGKLRAPNLPIKFSPDNLSIDRLSVEDGTLTLADAANGAQVTLTGLWFNGEARSLLGPFKGEGAATVGGELYPFRLTTGRVSDSGALKLKLNVDPVSRPLSIVADGTLTLAGGKAAFDGALNLARPVILAARGPAKAGDSVTPPWRLSGKIKANAASALMQQFEFQYGSDEQGFKLTGVADFTFGRHPNFNGVLSGRQVDLDRVFAGDDGTRPPPAAAIRKIAQLTAGAFRPAIPIRIGVGIDQVTLGGNSIANVRGDISTDAAGWNLDRFEFRAPGFTQVKLSGRLAVGEGKVSFSGPADIEATDPKLLAAWLEGRPEPAKGEPQPLKLRGDVTFGSDKIAVERLQAAFDRKTVTGRIAYVFASAKQAAKLDAVLNAPELDVDAALGFGRALTAGSAIERPRDMTIAADIGRASVAGLSARDISALVTVDGNGFAVDHLSVGDLGGASFSAKGRIDATGHAPRGSLTVDFESGQAAAIAALVDQYAPGTAKAAGDLLARVQHAKLHAKLDIADDGKAGMSVARAAVTGALDAVTIDLKAQARGDWDKIAAADVRLDGTLAAPDGAKLIALVGLDRYLVAGEGAGEFKLLVAGRGDKDQQIDLRLHTGALAAQSIGHGRISLDKGLKMTSRLEVAKADLRPLRPAGTADSAASLPLTLTARVAVSDRAVGFDDLEARLGGTTLHGKLAVDGQKVSGALDADTLDAAPLIAAAIGLPVTGKITDGAAWAWASEPFAGGMFGDHSGEIALKARQAALLPRLTAREFRAALRLQPDGLAVDNISGTVAGGRLTGALSFQSGQDGLKTHATFALAGVDAASMLPSAARPPLGGTLDLSADIEGSGLSPVALIGSLQGSGKIALADAQIAGLDPHAFDAVTRAVDQGLPIDTARISDAVGKALDSGDFAVKRIDGTLAVSAGQVRLGKTAVDGKDAALSLSGDLDLTDGSLDARLVLSGVNQAAGARPNIFMALKGPLANPKRSVDVSALTGWLTLRAVENQARQIREMEKAQRQAPPPKPKSELAPALPAPVEVKKLPNPTRRVTPAASASGAKN